MSASGTSILDQMAIDVTKTKKDANARLTPRGAEKKADAPVVEVKGPLDVPGLPFPYDTTGMLAQALRNARREVDFILRGIEAIETLYGLPPQIDEPSTAVESAGTKRAKERNADAAAEFAAKFKADQEAAQAAVYKDGAVEDPPEKLFAAPPAAWSCEKHGKSVEATSRRGRPYLKCPVDGCEEFEHLV